MDPTIILCFALSFIVTYLVVPLWIRHAIKNGHVGKDMNKPDKREVPESGGIAVIFGFAFGALSYIFLQVFYFGNALGISSTFAILLTVFMAGFIGFIDDIIRLRQLPKVLLTIPIAVPLVVVNAGTSVMNIPFIGSLDFGIIYPLLIVPIGIIGASNAYNMLAGHNGLEAGMGIIILFFLSYAAYATGSIGVCAISMCMAFALLAFYRYNRFPAKIFPGDSLTYPVGAIIACIAITGNLEKIAVFLFIPYFAKFLLFARFKLSKKGEDLHAFGKPQADGSIKQPYEKIYDVTHLAIALLEKIKGKAYERDVSRSIILFEAALCLIAYLLFL